MTPIAPRRLRTPAIPRSFRALAPLSALALLAGCVAPPAAPVPYAPVYIQPPPNYLPPPSATRLPTPLLPPMEPAPLPAPLPPPDADVTLEPLLPPDPAAPLDTAPIEIPTPIPGDATSATPPPSAMAPPVARPAPAAVPMMGFRPMRGQTPVTP